MCFELVGLLKKASHAFTNSYTVHICNCSVYCRGKGKDVIYHTFFSERQCSGKERGRKKMAKTLMLIISKIECSGKKSFKHTVFRETGKHRQIMHLDG